MRFKSYLLERTEVADVETFYDDYAIQGLDKSYKSFTKIFNEDGSLVNDFRTLSLYAKHTVTDFFWPGEKKGKIDKLILNRLDDSTTILKEFGDLPVAKDIYLFKVTVKSLRGVQGMSGLEHIKVEHDADHGEVKFECGLLSFLKLSSLKSIDIAKEGMEEKLTGAIAIINSHLKGNRSVPDCQQELIEEGFQEYAKL